MKAMEATTNDPDEAPDHLRRCNDRSGDRPDHRRLDEQKNPMSIYYHRGRITLGRIITSIAPRIRIRWLILFALFLILGGFAHAHDATRPDLNSWFNQLKSGKGYCCSNGDGTALSDVDWEATGGHYRVRIEGEWIAVPDEAVITEPNLAGRTMVWPYRADGKVLFIRCFIPGAGI